MEALKAKIVQDNRRFAPDVFLTKLEDGKTKVRCQDERYMDQGGGEWPRVFFIPKFGASGQVYLSI